MFGQDGLKEAGSGIIQMAVFGALCAMAFYCAFLALLCWGIYRGAMFLWSFAGVA
jgi:hypothetical protein